MKVSKSYKKKGKSLGGSDSAMLTVVGGQDDPTGYKPSVADVIQYGGDGEYSAWIVEDSEVEIPDHYHLVFTAIHYLNVYDDYSLVYKARADVINIYRAGERGTIIQLLNKVEESKNP